MKLLSACFLILCFTSLCFGQKNILKAKFENIEHLEDVKMYGDDIYCSGFSFKTIINDGNACDGYLVNYDKLTLKPKWSIRISDEPTNKVNSIIRFNDKIYALVTRGKELPSSQDVYLSLFVIKLNGEIEEKINFGPSFSSPSNIEIEGNNLCFGYQLGTNITYSNNDLRSVIVKYNLETKEIVRFKSKQYQARPSKLLLNNADAYLFGIYIHTDQPNLLSYKKGKFSEITLKSSKSDYFLDSYINGKILTVVSVYPGAYKDTQTYLKYYYVNLETNQITTKSIPYKQLGWSDIRFDTFSTGSSTWIIVEEIKSRLLKYVLIDNSGKIIQTLNYGNGNGYKENFIIDKNILLNTGKGKIEINEF